MAKFYQPKETQGIYDAGANRLTVNQDDRVLIGFRALSQKELQDTTVDTTEDVVTARYSINSSTIELDIDTSSAIDFKATATQDVAMSAVPKKMTKPLEVVIRRPSYTAKPPVGQQRDPAGCWAACLSYWLSVAPGREDRSFINIVGDFSGLWDRSGFIKVDGFRAQVAKQRQRYRMATERILPKNLKNYIGRWPLLIGFRHPGGFGHMNVLTAYDWSNDLIRAMDPWYPDPPAGTLTRLDGQVIFNGNEGNFQFSGLIAYRSLAYYESPMPSGTILIGYPEEYQRRMP